MGIFLNTIPNIEISMDEKQLKMFGTGIIVLGLLMLIFTFFQSYVYMNSPYPALKPPESSGGGQPDINKAIAEAFMPFFGSMIPLAYTSGYLFIMGLVGFWIMGRGIQILRSPK